MWYASVRRAAQPDVSYRRHVFQQDGKPKKDTARGPSHALFGLRRGPATVFEFMWF